MELIRAQQSRLIQARQQQGVCEGDESFLSTLSRPMSPKGIHHNWGPSGATSTPVGSSNSVGRRRSVGSFPYIYKCNHHAAGHACSCWDPTPSSVLEDTPDCCCNSAAARLNNLGNIQEVRESAEDLLDNDTDTLGKGDDGLCARCGNPASMDRRCEVVGSRQVFKRHLRRSCTWQYPTENFDDEDASCNGGSGDRMSSSDSGNRLFSSNDYATDSSGDNTTESRDGFMKR